MSKKQHTSNPSAKKSSVPKNILAEEFGNEFAEVTTSKQFNASEHTARQRYDK
ncbi:hypothetical protein [Bacillus sp. Marseille-P3661]|uniref:hypothetical protein n=1 Tax=Bacillus sp. Marseille-P3661 TaxID=1936234 RepID=UPI0015E1996E|nr:hypothetical protein [Bacillus sp. Marseille-P3661]